MNRQKDLIVTDKERDEETMENEGERDTYLTDRHERTILKLS